MKRFLKFPIFAVLTTALLFTSCSDDDDNKLEDVQPIADFEFVVDMDNPLLVRFTNISINAQSLVWDFGDGNTSADKNPEHVYPKGGEYTVTLTATNGEETDSAEKKVLIEEDKFYPVGNVFNGNDMDDPDAWTVYAGADEPIEYTWTDGTLLFTGTASEEITYQTHVWQAFEVEAGSYRFAAEISGGGDGFNNAYLEFLIGRPEPVDGENSTNGIITFHEAGTYYFVIKSGYWNGSMGPGMSVLNVSLAPVDE